MILMVEYRQEEEEEEEEFVNTRFDKFHLNGNFK